MILVDAHTGIDENDKVDIYGLGEKRKTDSGVFHHKYDPAN
jgi:hypothetical protein